jgi:long-subunit acyl-CoA synthetase (AMP-forming)
MVRPKSPRAIARAIDPDEPALLLFTSGTTGTPKGVVWSFRALQARIDANIAVIVAAKLSRALVSLPTHGTVSSATR